MADKALDQLSINHVVYLDFGIYTANADIRLSMHKIHRPSAATASGFVIVVSYDIDDLTWVSFIWVLGESTDDHMFLADRSKDGLMVEWLVGTEFDVKELCNIIITAEKPGVIL